MSKNYYYLMQELTKILQQDDPKKFLKLFTPRFLLTNKAMPTFGKAGFYKTSPIIIASIFGSPKIVGALLKEKTDPDQEDIFGQTALITNANQPECDSTITIAKHLIKHHADTNKTNHMGRSALMNAAKHGNYWLVDLLISKKADLNLSDNYGCTALMLSLLPDFYIQEKNATTQKLIEAGAKLDKTDALGRTALLLAAQNNNLDAVKLLLKAGATIYGHKYRGKTLPELLVSEFSISRILREYIMVARVATYQPNLSKLNTTNTYLQTKLNKLEKKPNAESVWKLLEETPLHDHTEITDENGWSALMIAILFNDANVVEKLIQANFDINYKSPDGLTALMVACCLGHDKIVHMLLNAKQKLSIDEKDTVGWSALAFATYCGHINTVSILLDYKANINSIDIDKRSPLLIAVSCKDIDMVRLLIKRGADKEHKYRGKTAYDWAMLEEKWEIESKGFITIAGIIDKQRTNAYLHQRNLNNFKRIDRRTEFKKRPTKNNEKKEHSVSTSKSSCEENSDSEKISDKEEQNLIKEKSKENKSLSTKDKSLLPSSKQKDETGNLKQLKSELSKVKENQVIFRKEINENKEKNKTLEKTIKEHAVWFAKLQHFIENSAQHVITQQQTPRQTINKNEALKSYKDYITNQFNALMSIARNIKTGEVDSSRLGQLGIASKGLLLLPFIGNLASSCASWTNTKLKNKALNNFSDINPNAIGAAIIADQVAYYLVIARTQYLNWQPKPNNLADNKKAIELAKKDIDSLEKHIRSIQKKQFKTTRAFIESIVTAVTGVSITVPDLHVDQVMEKLVEIAQLPLTKTTTLSTKSPLSANTFHSKNSNFSTLENKISEISKQNLEERSKLSKQLELLKNKQRNEITNLKNLHVNRTEELSKKLKEADLKHQEEITKLNSKMEGNDKIQSVVNDLKKSDIAYKEQQQKITNEILELKKSQEEEIQSLTNQHTNNITTLEKQINELNHSYDQNVKNLKKQIETQEERYNEDMDEIRLSNVKLKSKVTKVVQRNKKIELFVDQLSKSDVTIVSGSHGQIQKFNLPDFFEIEANQKIEMQSHVEQTKQMQIEQTHKIQEILEEQDKLRQENENLKNKINQLTKDDKGGCCIVM